MKIKNWLTINERGVCKLTKGKPSLDWNEITIFLDLDIPDSLFKKPFIEAKITVSNELVAHETIQAVVAENVQEAIQQATGLRFSVAVVEPEKVSA